MSFVLTEDQSYALEMFRSGKSIFLTGGSGTGKSAVIKEMLAIAKAEGRRIGVTASTGIAASLLPGGRTIHSLLQSYPKMNYYGIDYHEKAARLESIDVLVIDEISMLGKRFIPYLFRCLSSVRNHIQLIVVGDFFQIPPVKDGYAFESPYWDKLNLTPCILNQVVRQNDEEMIRNLNLLKYGDVDCLPYFISHSSGEFFENQITICAKTEDAKRVNQEKLDRIEGLSSTYEAKYEDRFSDSDIPVERNLTLKVGSRVMTVVNSTEYVNGSLGTVTELSDDLIVVRLDNGVETKIKRHVFDTGRSNAAGEKITVRQFPLVLAYAITIHKSQGQTFEFVNIDAAACWEAGQLYVAISRAKSVDHIHFISPVTEKNIKVSDFVVQFYRELEAKQAAGF